MRFQYTYNVYPHSPRATMKSKQLGILTCFPMLLVFGFFWCGLVYSILWNGLGMSDGLSMGLGFVSLIGFAHLVGLFRKAAAQKIERMAMNDLLNSPRRA